MSDAFIVAALRTAGGQRKGDLSAVVIDALMARSGVDPAPVTRTSPAQVARVLVKRCLRFRNLVTSRWIWGTAPLE